MAIQIAAIDPKTRPHSPSPCISFHPAVPQSPPSSSTPALPPPPRTPRIISPPTSSPQTAPSPSRSPTINISLQQPSSKKKNTSRSSKFFRHFRSIFRSFPIINPTCRIPVSLHGSRHHEVHIHGGTKVTGTLFGHRKSRVNLAIQESPKSVPVLVLELAIPTGKLLHDVGLGLVRVALECEKKHPSEKTKLIDEPIWTMYRNGRKVGYAVRREPSEDDLAIMQMLHAVSMGAGVLPSETGDMMEVGVLTYMRAQFERVIGSKDSETYYMTNPDGNSGPELSIFFVRI
ncbi:hypothetical protein CRG98_010784 [Punica granatum]|nr:hypothetical protein CRG98_010784 [Punica granatum]